MFCEFVAAEEDADRGNSMEVDLDAFDLSLVGFETIDEDGGNFCEADFDSSCLSLFDFEPFYSEEDGDEACSAELINIELFDGPVDSEEDADEACSAELADIELFDGKMWKLSWPWALGLGVLVEQLDIRLSEGKLWQLFDFGFTDEIPEDDEATPGAESTYVKKNSSFSTAWWNSLTSLFFHVDELMDDRR